MYKELKFKKAPEELFFDMFRNFFITEKSANYEIAEDTITFIGHKWCNKSLVKKCFESMLGGKAKVRVMNTSSKRQTKHTKKGTMHMCHNPKKKFMVHLEKPAIEKVKELFND